MFKSRIYIENDTTHKNRKMDGEKLSFLSFFTIAKSKTVKKLFKKNHVWKENCRNFSVEVKLNSLCDLLLSEFPKLLMSSGHKSHKKPCYISAHAKAASPLKFHAVSINQKLTLLFFIKTKIYSR